MVKQRAAEWKEGPGELETLELTDKPEEREEGCQELIFGRIETEDNLLGQAARAALTQRYPKDLTTICTVLEGACRRSPQRMNEVPLAIHACLESISSGDPVVRVSNPRLAKRALRLLRILVEIHTPPRNTLSTAVAVLARHILLLDPFLSRTAVRELCTIAVEIGCFDTQFFKTALKKFTSAGVAPATPEECLELFTFLHPHLPNKADVFEPLADRIAVLETDMVPVPFSVCAKLLSLLFMNAPEVCHGSAPPHRSWSSVANCAMESVYQMKVASKLRKEVSDIQTLIGFVVALRWTTWHQALADWKILFLHGVCNVDPDHPLADMSSITPNEAASLIIAVHDLLKAEGYLHNPRGVSVPFRLSSAFSNNRLYSRMAPGESWFPLHMVVAAIQRVVDGAAQLSAQQADYCYQGLSAMGLAQEGRAIWDANTTSRCKAKNWEDGPVTLEQEFIVYDEKPPVWKVTPLRPYPTYTPSLRRKPRCH